MNFWLALIAGGSLLMAYSMNNPNNLGGAIADARTKILQSRMERVYAATGNAGMVMGSDSVRDHITGLRAIVPQTCLAGHRILDREYKQNSSSAPAPEKNAQITHQVNTLCDL